MSKKLKLLIAALACILCCSLEGLSQENATTQRCDAFELKDYRGKSLSLADVKTPHKVIAFLGTECPLAKLYAVRLNEFATEFADDVTVIGINANTQDSMTEIAAFVKRHEIAFPMLKDLDASVADDLDAKRTPEVFLLDADNVVRYRGRIDDQYGVGYARSEPARDDLRIAIECLIADNKIEIAKTEAVGCFIGRVAKTTPVGAVSYSNQVARILQKHCVECHREGQIAPFALTDYDEVVGWSDTIREVIEERRMPPWHADPGHGSFSNDRSMPDEDKQALFDWIENGMPKGDDSDLPSPQNYVEGWSLPRAPDVEVAMSVAPFAVPAEGTVDYQYFVADPGFTEDKWVSAAEVIPGNRAVVHHAIVFVRPPNGEQQDGIGWLTAFVPGQSLLSLPSGMARRIPKGSKLVFQMHYTPVGAETEDTTKVGLVFADPSTLHTEVQTRIVIDRDFEIPPRVKNFEVEMSTSRFPPGSKLLAIAPHMHYRGTRFRVAAESENSSKVLLEVPNYDFNWQHAYRLKEPLPLDNVRLDCLAAFDNSAENLVNPDPEATVRWGDQTWEEMAMAYLAISVPLQAGKANVAERNSQIVSEKQSRKVSLEEREQQAQQAARKFFDSLDENGDGEILRAETSSSFRAFAWRDFDQNGDDKLSWEEVLQQARISKR